MSSDKKIQQISLSMSSQKGSIIPAASASEEQRKSDLETIRQAAVDISPNWTSELHTRFCHSPLYVPPSHFHEIQKLQEALGKAVVSIIDRWWTDKEADFPRRMPIRQYEEDLLKWIVRPGQNRTSTYKGHEGLWRPDYLIENQRDAAGNQIERIRICEINARFPYNGYFCTAYMSQAYAKLGHTENLKFTCEPQRILDSLMTFFDPSLPLHILQGEWPGFDVHLFAAYYRQHTGQQVTYITTSSLRLVSSSEAGYLLYRLVEPSGKESPAKETITENGETLERIYQVSIELMQPELEKISQDILRQLSTCCVNDFRTTLLVHDKRMLGIVLSDLDNLVNKYDVLTAAEADILSRGITPTILPRSSVLNPLLSKCEADPALKNSYVLKAIRGGLGLGHVFGNEVENAEWLEKLRGLRNADLTLEQNLYAVQRRIEQVEYDIVRQNAEEPGRFYLVGSYLTFQGRYLAGGPFRIGKRTHLKLNDVENGIVMMTLTKNGSISEESSTSEGVEYRMALFD